MVWSDCTLSPRFQSADCLKNQDVQKELLSLLRHVKQKKNGKMWEFWKKKKTGGRVYLNPTLKFEQVVFGQNHSEVLKHVYNRGKCYLINLITLSSFCFGVPKLGGGGGPRHGKNFHIFPCFWFDNVPYLFSLVSTSIGVGPKSKLFRARQVFRYFR